MPLTSITPVPYDADPEATLYHRPVTDQQLREIAAEEDAKEPSLSQAWGIARELDSTAAITARKMLEIDKSYDPKYVLTEDALKNSGVPQEYWDELAVARSDEHFNLLVANTKHELELESMLARKGWAGAGVRIGANLADEGAIGLSLISSPLASLPTKATRLARAVKLGLIAGAENAALEAYAADSSATRDYEDVLYSGLFGFATGGAIGSVGRAIPESEALKGIAVRAMNEMDAELAANAAGKVRHRSAGAAAASEEDLPSEAAFTSFAPGRYDVVGYLKSRDVESARSAGNWLAEDAVGHRDFSASGAGGTASEIATRLQRTMEDSFRRVSEFAFDDWMKARGRAWGGRKFASFTERESFYREVGDYVRGTKPDADPHVKKAGDAMRLTLKGMLRELKDAGVKGFADIPENAHYLPRIHRFDKLEELNAKFGTVQLERLFAKGILNASDNLVEEQATKVARAYVRSLFKQSAGRDDVQFARILDSENADELARILREETGLDDAHIESILYDVQGAGGDGRISRAKRRLDIDETTKETLFDDAGRAHEVAISDLLENNAERLLGLYLRQTAGHVGLARAGGIRSRADWNKLINSVREEAQAKGKNLPSMVGGKSEADRIVERLQFLYDAITGRPLEADPKSAVSQGLRAVRDLNFLRLMNMTGFAQIAEFGSLLSHAGLRNVMKHVPEVKRMLTRAREGGRLDDELADELEAMTGIGSDWMRNQPGSMWEEEPLGITASGRAFERTRTLLDAGKRVTSAVSGMAPITTVLQRFALKGISQRFLNYATGSKPNMRRLAQAGLSKPMLDRVLKQIRKHSDSVDSAWGGRKLKRLNVEAWDDLEARSHFTMAMFRLARRVVQENDVGTTAMWMHGTPGKTIMQFRSFMATAYSKQLLYNLKMADMETAMNFMLTTTFAGMAYIARVQTQAQFKDEAEKRKFLKERLTTEAIAKSAFQQAGYSSIIPLAVDTMSQWSGGDPVFAYGRTTGLATGGFTSNPTIDALNRLTSIPRSVIGPLRDDYEFSRQDYRNLVSLLPWSNAIGVSHVFNALEAEMDLPKRSTDDYRR